MIKRLTKCIREYKKPSLLSPLFVTLEVIIEVFIPTLMASIIDEGIAANNSAHIIITGLLLVVLALLSLTFGALSGKYAAIAFGGICKKFKKRYV